MPELLDLDDVAAAERGQRLLGEPGRDADAQAARRELEQREASARIEMIEHVAQCCWCIGAAEPPQTVDHRRKAE